MTTINNFDDILSAMEQNPQLREAMRNHILGEEFLQLPSIVRQSQDLIVRVMEKQIELSGTVRQVLEEITGALTSHIEMNNRIIATIVDRQDRMEADGVELKEGQNRLEVSAKELQEGQARMEARQDRMESDVAELKAGQSRMEGQLNNLTGADYERKVSKRAPRIARRHLYLQRVSVVYGITVPDNKTIAELLDRATENGSITDEQAGELERADLILAGANPADEPAYAVAEVSLTIDEHDVDRARNRARILQDASGAVAKAAVIGTAISDANRQRAEQDNVAVVIMAE
jgi:hypothetical protein